MILALLMLLSIIPTPAPRVRDVNPPLGIMVPRWRPCQSAVEMGIGQKVAHCSALYYSKNGYTYISGFAFHGLMILSGDPRTLIAWAYPRWVIDGR